MSAAGRAGRAAPPDGGAERPALDRRPAVLGPADDDAARRRRGARRRGGTLARVIHARETDPGARRAARRAGAVGGRRGPRLRRRPAASGGRAATSRSPSACPQTSPPRCTRAKALGQQAWLEARAANDFSPFRDALARQVELRHRYVACFTGFEHPYDALLDDFEPGLTTAELRPLFGELRDALVPLVAAAGDREQPRNDGALPRQFDAEAQRIAVLDVLEAHRLRPRPLAARPGAAPVRLRHRARRRAADHEATTSTTSPSPCTRRCTSSGTGCTRRRRRASCSARRSTTRSSLGIHESQSRTWENMIGRSRPFCAWLLPRLTHSLPGAVDGARRDRALPRRQHRPAVAHPHRGRRDDLQPPHHPALRARAGADRGLARRRRPPAAWDEGMQRLLGVEVAGAGEGVLQDVHWSAGLMGYFPTYTLGNLMAAQLWERLRDDLPDVDALIERGEFAPAARVAARQRPPPRPQVPAARAAAPRDRRRAARGAVPALLAGEARRTARRPRPPRRYGERPFALA